MRIVGRGLGKTLLGVGRVIRYFYRGTKGWGRRIFVVVMLAIAGGIGYGIWLGVDGASHWVGRNNDLSGLIGIGVFLLFYIPHFMKRKRLEARGLMPHYEDTHDTVPIKLGSARSAQPPRSAQRIPTEREFAERHNLVSRGDKLGRKPPPRPQPQPRSAPEWH